MMDFAVWSQALTPHCVVAWYFLRTICHQFALILSGFLNGWKLIMDPILVKNHESIHSTHHALQIWSASGRSFMSSPRHQPFSPWLKITLYPQLTITRVCELLVSHLPTLFTEAIFYYFVWVYRSILYLNKEAFNYVSLFSVYRSYVIARCLFNAYGNYLASLWFS